VCSYRIGLLYSFSSKNVWILLRAYLTYVRPILEHNTVIWSPYLKKDIYRVESVQKLLIRLYVCNAIFLLYLTMNVCISSA